MNRITSPTPPQESPVSSKKKPIWFLGGLGTILLAIILVLNLPQNKDTKASSAVKETTVSSSTKQTEEDSASKFLEAAEKAVKFLEQNQVTDHVQSAQDAVDKIKDPAKKASLQKRIELVKLAISVREAEAQALADANSKVTYLENNQFTEHVQPAQDAVDKLKAGEQKDALQHRIELVKLAISVREAEAAAHAEAQAAAAATQAAQQSAQTYQAPSYSYQAPSGNGGGYVAPPADGGGNSNVGGTGPGGTATQDDVNDWEGPNRTKKFIIGD